MKIRKRFFFISLFIYTMLLILFKPSLVEQNYGVAVVSWCTLSGVDRMFRQKIFVSRCLFSENFGDIIQIRGSLDETEQDSGESPSVRTRPLTERFCITGREEKIPFADDGDIQPFVSTRFVFLY